MTLSTYIRRALTVSLAVGLLGCDAIEANQLAPKDAETTTLLTTPSPDGLFTARVQEEDNAGPGNNFITLTVTLVQKALPNAPVEILTLDASSVSRDQVAHLVQATWIDKDHLSLRYRDAEVLFQAVKAIGVDISTTRLPD